MGSVVVLDKLSRAKLRTKRWVMPALVVFVVLSWEGASFLDLQKGMEEVAFSSSKDFDILRQAGGVLDKVKGRVLVEDTIGLKLINQSRLGKTHAWAATPLWTNASVIGAGDRWSIKNDFGAFLDFAKRPILDEGPEGVLRLLRILGADRILYFSNIFDFVGTKEEQIGPLKLKTLTETGHFFNDARREKGLLRAVGEQSENWILTPVLDESVGMLQGRAVVEGEGTGLVIFKMRFWPNWMARVDGYPTRIDIDERGIMMVLVRSGSHVVEFSFEPRWVNKLGSKLTMLGLFGVCLCFIWGNSKLGMVRKAEADKEDKESKAVY